MLIFCCRVYIELNNILWFIFCFSDDLKKEEDIKCELCLNDDWEILVIYFCKICKDFEFFCDNCVN